MAEAGYAAFNEILKKIYSRSMLDLFGDPRHNERREAIGKRQRRPSRRGYQYIDKLAKGEPIA